jgi:hypothetical protein
MSLSCSYTGMRTTVPHLWQTVRRNGGKTRLVMLLISRTYAVRASR